HRRIGTPRQFAAVAVEQPDAEIMGFADHRAARRAFDGEFDFGFDRIQRSFDDLQYDRVDRYHFTLRCGRPRMRRGVYIHRGASFDETERMTRMPCGSTSKD